MFQYGAFRRWYLFLLAFVAICLAAGLVYGWPALRRNLRDSGGSNLSEKTLGGIFAAGAWSTQGGRFLFGIARDRYGTKITCALSLTCVVGGSLGLALSDPNGAPQLGLSMFLVGLGSGAQLCLQPVAGLFIRSGTVVSSLSGAFQISGLIFLALTSIPYDRRATFGGFSLVIAGIAVLSAIALPRGPSFVLEVDDEQPASAEFGKSEEPTLANESAKNAVDKESFEESGLNQIDVSNGLKDDVSADQPVLDASANKSTCQKYKEIITNMEYVALVTWFSICVVPLQYYVGTIGFQLEDKGDDNGKYMSIFSIAYAAASGFAPFGGYLADLTGLGATQGLATILCATSMFVLASGVNLDGQVPGLCTYGLGRMLVFGMFFANVGKRFGYANYGTLAGLGLLLSAIMSLLQYPLIALAADGNAIKVNIVCGAVMVGVLPYCAWLGVKERRKEPNIVDEQKTTSYIRDDCDASNSTTEPQRQHFRASYFAQ